MAKEMFDKMQEELDKIKSILQNSKLTGKIPDIERDIMLAKLRNVYEFLLLYQPEIIKDQPIKEKKQEKTIPYEEKPKPEVIIQIEEPVQVEEIKTENKQQPEIIETPEPISAPNPEPVAPLTDEHIAKKKSSPAHKPILAEKLGTKNSFLCDVLAQYANNNSYAKKFQNSPISNIFSAIGINERFQLIKELFGNNVELYQVTIEKINNAAGFNDAIQYIANNFNWDFENPTVHKLLELIRRRHPNDAK